MVKFIVNHKIGEIKFLFLFFKLDREWMFRRPISKSWYVLCLVRRFPKGVFSYKVSSFKLFFRFEMIGGLVHLAPPLPLPYGVGL